MRIALNRSGGWSDLPAPMLSTVQSVAAHVVFVTLRREEQQVRGWRTNREQGWLVLGALNVAVQQQPKRAAVGHRRLSSGLVAASQPACQVLLRAQNDSVRNGAHLLANSPIQLSSGPVLQSTVLLYMGRPSCLPGA